MSASAIARNYAATLFELAGRDGSEASYGEWIDEVGSLFGDDRGFRRFLEAPSVASSEKKDVLRRAFEGRAPEPFIRFLMVVLDRRRQRVLPRIARAYRDLLDERAGRVRATVTLPFEADERARADIVDALERRLGKTVVPDFRTDEKILGGVIIKVGDELFDASLRRQLERMRRELQLR
ncbi:MAG: ATP synthase F1 subunit delta [Gemmatimonadota bacterium]|nr:ATP synthase F1 subunit delta [Gemmatimonadota bacterium]